MEITWTQEQRIRELHQTNKTIHQCIAVIRDENIKQVRAVLPIPDRNNLVSSIWDRIHGILQQVVEHNEKTFI